MLTTRAEAFSLVLGAGGRPGLAYHAGTLLALDLHGLCARDAVSITGTSAGSIVAAVLTGGGTAEDLAAYTTGRENPNEVVVLVLEDHVEAEHAIAVLKRSGIAGHALSWRPGDPLPTLGEMIRRGDNVVVLVENDGGSEPWYIPAYDMLQETPYEFPQPRDFSCDLGRGAAENPLFMVNHWLKVDPLSRAVAREANARDVLLTRAEKCASERRQLPNIVAVDFYADGDLFDVVDTLNGVAPP